ncbi:MAG: FkbM family methyltransferase [Pseudomonadota bacterium]
MEMLTKRFWKKRIAKSLPDFVKTPIKRRLMGYRPSSVGFDLSFAADEDNYLIATIDQTLRLKIPKHLQSFVQHAFMDNADCIEEMYGFISVAKDQKAKTLFDVGAQHGLLSLIFCSCKKDNRAIAYEPVPNLSQAMESLFQKNNCADRVMIQNCAIGHREGELDLYLQEDYGFVQICPSDQTCKTVKVKVTTVDEECARFGIYPDVLKIDVEGYEYEVLCGSERLLKNNKPTICLELHLDYLEQRGINPKSIFDLLEKCGYRFFSGTGHELNPRAIYDTVKSLFRFVAK